MASQRRCSLAQFQRDVDAAGPAGDDAWSGREFSSIYVEKLGNASMANPLVETSPFNECSSGGREYVRQSRLGRRPTNQRMLGLQERSSDRT